MAHVIRSISIRAKTRRQIRCLWRGPHIRNVHKNRANLDAQIHPLPMDQPSRHHRLPPTTSNLNSKTTPSRNDKTYYLEAFGQMAMNRQNCFVTTIDVSETNKFKERLNNAAGLYDGWFSRNVENLDLDPSNSCS